MITDTSQSQVQHDLDTIKSQQGLSAALEALYHLECDLGYIEPERLKDNRWFFYPDARYDLNFETQINYLRHHYQKDMQKVALQQKLDCAICIENLNLPHKANMRVFEFDLNQERFFAQLTPYPLYKKHFVLITKKHRPMCMSGNSVKDLCDFLDMAPSYTACSNSDVHMAGASILAHHHYQVFDNVVLPIQKAKARFEKNQDGVHLALLNYPIAVLRITGDNKQTLVEKARAMIALWKSQRTNNTCNLLVDKKDDLYRCHILFRHPEFLTPDAIQPIKNEGIGIVEVSGCGIYPVPEGDNEKAIWHTIEHQGLDVIHTIISSNSPIKEQAYDQFWHMLTSAS